MSYRRPAALSHWMVVNTAVARFLKELRRRRVFRVAGLYVVVIWLLMQVADIVFPAWGIPDAAIRLLLWAGLLGFPVALVFGWIFDISAQGIRRTQPASSAELRHAMPLRRADYLILSAFLVVLGAIVYDTTGRVMETASLEEWRPSQAEIEPNSVAVLPFTNLSGDAEQEYFADGISEEILNRLAMFRELKVIARTSSFAFKDSGYDIGRISGLLAVKYLLQGSVRRDGLQLRIAAQLVDQSGVQVWQQSFDRELGAIFRLQDEIAEAVATSIVPQIVPPAMDAREPELDAYLEYMAGREIMARRPSDWGRLSSVPLSRAIEIDPEFAEPYAARAVGTILNAYWTDAPALEYDRAQQDIETALEMKPDLGLAHAAWALLLEQQNSGTPAERESILRRALELDPNLVEAWNWLAGALSAQGRPAEGLEALKRGARIDPLAPIININLAMRDAREGRFADAERRLNRMLEIPRSSAMVFVTLCALHKEAGRIADALECGKRRILELAPTEPRPYGTWILFMPYAMLGMVEEAEYWIARHNREWPGMYQRHLWRAYVLGPATGHLPMREAIEDFEAALQSFGMDEEQLDTADAAAFGLMVALAGDYERAIPLLEPWVNPEGSMRGGSFGYYWGVRNEAQALAWAWQQTGQDEKAARLLDGLDREFRAEQAEARQHLSEDRFEYARNALLLGNREQALELLEQAAEAGWRGYYGIRADPRWDPLREEPKFQAVLAKVKADLDAQRAQVEAIEADDDFIARYDAAMAEQARRAEQTQQ
jgi:TolB-like protein/Tfp pilus assembly protein PilF